MPSIDELSEYIKPHPLFNGRSKSVDPNAISPNKIKKKKKSPMIIKDGQSLAYDSYGSLDDKSQIAIPNYDSSNFKNNVSNIKSVEKV